MIFLSNNRTSNFCSVFSGCLFSLVSMYYSHLFKNMFLVIRVPRSIFIAKTPEQYKQSGRRPGLHLTVTTPQRELLFSGQWSSRALLSMTTYMASAFFPRSRGDDRAPELVSWPLGHSQGACPSSCRSTAQAWICTATSSSRHSPPTWASGKPCLLSCEQHCSQSPREVSVHVHL